MGSQELFQSTAFKTHSYRYNCIDKSILLPYFKRYYVSLYYRFIPAWLTANFITLISTASIIVLLLLLLLVRFSSPYTLTLAIVICLHTYIVGDHLDGMQAKNTGTGSPLGEFLDHYLDVFNGAIVFYTIALYLAPIPDGVFYLLLFLNGMAFAVTMYEELERKELYFGPVGTLEGVILIILFLLSWMIPAAREFWQSHLILGYPKYWIAIVFVAVGYTATIMDVMGRVRYITLHFGVFLVAGVVLAVLLYLNHVPQFTGWLLFTLFSGEYIAKIMESHLVGTPKRYPDPVILLFISVFCALQFIREIPAANLHALLMLAVLYLAFKVVYLFSRIVYSLRGYWIWINPEPLPSSN